MAIQAGKGDIRLFLGQQLDKLVAIQAGKGDISLFIGQQLGILVAIQDGNGGVYFRLTHINC